MRSLVVFIGCLVFIKAVIIAPIQRPNCGKTPIKPDTSTRIVGGTEAIPYSWPWQAEICRDNGSGSCNFICGGSVIAKKWIMSAAHCVNGYTDQPGKFGIRVGIFDYRDNTEPGAMFFNVTEIHMHPKFGSPQHHSHDISLLKLAGKITFNNHIQPVCIPKSVANIVHTGKSAWVTGWGATFEGGPAIGKLRQVLVPFLDQSECKKIYGTSIDQTQECAGGQGVDACQGDSGGPLVTQHNDTGLWFQAGIVSWGQGCGKKGYTGVYARPSSMCNFIMSTTGINLCQ
uniref:Peptidase S1 domain-containing protein n=1 Tax=Panagrolaimus sp. JU765 TaxID=591449 RepID=A0AC34Q429_9BILA